MRRLWIAYLFTAIGAIGIGVAIAGLPDSLPGDGADSATAVVVAVSVVETTAPITTAPLTTIAPPTTRAATTTASVVSTTIPTTTLAPTSTTTTTLTTVATTTTVPTTSTTTPPPTPADTRVAVANGAGVPGIARDAAELLFDAGFDDVTAVNSELVDVTTVYFVEGFEAMADLVAVELFIDPDAQADMSELPDLATDEEFDVVAVLGADIGS